MFGIEVTLGVGGGRCPPPSDKTLGGGARKCPPMVVVDGGPLCIWAAAGMAKATPRIIMPARRPILLWPRLTLHWSAPFICPSVYSNPLDVGKFLSASGC